VAADHPHVSQVFASLSVGAGSIQQAKSRPGFSKYLFRFFLASRCFCAVFSCALRPIRRVFSNPWRAFFDYFVAEFAPVPKFAEQGR